MVCLAPFTSFPVFPVALSVEGSGRGVLVDGCPIGVCCMLLHIVCYPENIAKLVCVYSG